MGIDLDPLDEIFPERAANNARAGGRFQPKGKLRPRKESLSSIPSGQSVQTVDIAGTELANLVAPSLATLETLESKKPLENNGGSVSGVHSSNDLPLVNRSLEHVVIGQTSGHNDGLLSDVVTPDVNGDCPSTTGKFARENADIFSELECLDVLYSQSTTAMVSVAGTSPHKVDLSFQPGNEFSTSCSANNAESSLTHSEIPAVYVSDIRRTEEGPHIPVVLPLDDSTVRVSNDFSTNPCPEVFMNQDPLTCGEAIVSNGDDSCYSDNIRLEIEEGDAAPCLETLDNIYELTTRSGRCSGKFQPKPKFQIERETPGANTSHLDAVESIPCPQQDQLIHSETECMNDGSIPTLPTDNNFLDLRFGDSTSEIPVNVELTNFMNDPCSEVSLPGEHLEDGPSVLAKRAKCRKRKATASNVSLKHLKASVSGQENEAGRSTRKLRKRKNVCELVDESEDEAHDDGDFPYECHTGSPIDEDDTDDGECQEANEHRNRKAPRKSKKSLPQKEKTVRKRKKANDVMEQSTKEPHKKFSHSTRRKRRQVDRVLLETPEDEIDIQKLRIRDIILLAEHRERILNKEGKTSDAPLTDQDQSGSNPFANYNEDACASEQGGGHNKDETYPRVQERSNYINYQSYMNKTQRSRWSKQDTELFYEAVQQFGSDISMIQQLFPGRTRTQVKLKFKKEEREHPLRLHEALTHRAKDHSHFQLVIDRLQQLAAEDKQNSYKDDSIDLTEVEEEEVNNEINEEVGKLEVEERKIEAMEPDVSEVASPVKSCDSEDDLSRWSQYKSEF